jgi:5-amino-6-(5-phosphoribosylamino)uracil reductase
MMVAMRTFACLATTLDGKIASSKAPKERFGSKTDLAHLLNTRNQADAILSGGETFRQFSGVRKGNASDRIPVQCILTRHFQLPPDASLFQKAKDNAISIIIFSPNPPAETIRKQYPEQVEWVSTGDNPVSAILETLRGHGVNTLSIEGGGQVVHSFLEAQALQELYLTICPVLLGGKEDPSLMSGTGFTVAEAPRTEILSSEWKDQELYLHLKIHYPIHKR